MAEKKLTERFKELLTSVREIVRGIGSNPNIFFHYNRDRLIDRPYAALKHISDSINEVDLNDALKNIKNQMNENDALASRYQKLAFTSFCILFACVLEGTKAVTFPFIKIENIEILQGPLILAFFYLEWKFINSLLLSLSCRSFIHNYFLDRHPENEAQIRTSLFLDINYGDLEAATFGNTSLTVGGKTAIDMVNKVDRSLLGFLFYAPIITTYFVAIWDMRNPSISYLTSFIVLFLSTAVIFSTFLKFGAYGFMPNAFVITPTQVEESNTTNHPLTTRE